MKKTMFYVGLVMALLVSTMTVQAQCTSTNYVPSECESMVDPASFAASIPGNSEYNRATAADTYYLRPNGGEPYGSPSNIDALNLAFGMGNYTLLTFGAADPAVVFSPMVNLVFMDGSGFGAESQEAYSFLTANQALIENWVTNGGVLLFNVADNTILTQNVGFNNTVFTNDGGANYTNTAEVVDPAFEALVGPNVPTSQVMTGNSWAHQRVSGVGLTNIVIRQGNPAIVALAEKDFGNGHLMFGGMTPSTFHNPQPNANNFRANLLVYLETLVNPAMPPMLNCPGDVTLNASPGACDAPFGFGTPIGVDPEGGSVTVTQTMGAPSPGPYPVGVTVIEFTATNDEAPNETTTCQFTITVVDDQAPTITCPADISQTNDLGLCSADVTVPAPTIMDNCPVMPNSPNPIVVGAEVPFNFGPSGLIDTPYTLTAPAMSMGGAVNVTVNYDGDFSFGTEIFLLEGPDGSVVYTGTPGGADCTTFYEETFAVDSATWNSWITTFGPDLTFVLQEDADVDAFCTNSSLQLTYQEASVGGTLSNDYNGTNDASGVYPVGTTTVTWTYTDGGGNSASCTMDITVTDDEAPEIVCIGGPAPATGVATATPGIAIPDSTPAGVTSTLDVVEDFDITDLNVNLDITHTWIGDLAVTLTAPDGVTTVQLVDRIGVPASGFGCNNVDPAINIDLDDEATLTVEDSCPEPYVGVFIPNGSLADFDGISTVGTWTLNISDNVGGDTGTLNAWSLNYSYDLAASPPFDVVLDVNGMATVTVADLLASATDNCGPVTATTEGSVGAPTMASITTLFDSNNGGADGGAVYFDVVVGAEDITINDLDLNTADPGAFTVEMYTLVGTSVGNEGDPAPWTLSATGSGTASGTINVPSNAVLDVPVVLSAGTTYGVALVMDATHGHSYSGTGTDPAPGMLMYSNADVTLNLGSGSNVPFAAPPFTPRIWNGTLNYTVIAGTPGPVTTFEVDCDDVGESEIEVTVTDAAGNASVCTATINVIDNIDPLLVCQNVTVEVGADGTVMLDPLDLIDFDNTVEACGIEVSGVSMDDFSCDDIGTPQVVTLFVSDPSGNLASCEATVTVVDLLAPEVTCPADTTVDPGANNQLYEVPDYFADGLASATDNCTDPVTIFAQDPAAGSFIGDGVYTVTLSATDEYGNVGTCTFELTVESILGANDNVLDTGVTLYPNPAQSQVLLSNTSNILLTKATMYDVNGKLVNTTDLSDMTTEKAIDISKLASGVYIVQIEGENASVVKRLIKE